MVRWIVIGSVGAIAFTVYALVDLSMTQAPRVRAFSKPAWIAIIVAIPLIGPLLWLLIGKSKRTGPRRAPGRSSPDDNPSFLGALERESSDERIRRLEEELKALDDDQPDSADNPDDQDPKPPTS
jgi:hypothetical protein